MTLMKKVLPELTVGSNSDMEAGWPIDVSVAFFLFFFSTFYLLDKVSWRPNFDRTHCPGDAKAVGHQTCRKPNLCLGTEQKIEVHITDHLSWNSCCKVVSDH